jgi:hypothetical protein
MIDDYAGRTKVFSDYLASSFDQELMAVIRRHRRVLLFGPLIAALLFYAINPDLPGTYVSKAYVRLDRDRTESLVLQRFNPVVADRLLGPHPDASRLYHLNTFMELVDAER